MTEENQESTGHDPERVILRETLRLYREAIQQEAEAGDPISQFLKKTIISGRSMDRINSPPPGEVPKQPRDPEALAAEVAHVFRRRQEAADWGPRRLSSFDEEVLEAMPRVDLELAVAVYTAMTTSESDEKRGAAASFIDLLFEADKETGAQLWRTLIDDPDQGISHTALLTVFTALESDRVSADEAVALEQAYEAAKETRPEKPFEPSGEIGSRTRALLAYHNAEDERDRLAAEQAAQSEEP